MLAEEVKKPLIIHCVKGLDEIIAMHKETVPQQAWIIHGFRGKPQQAEQLVKAGFYLSFGERFNVESLKATPLERLFVESDESNFGIYEIYRRISQTKGYSIEELAMTVRKNAANCNIIL
jgi:TatD DNase family protein